MVDDSDDSEDDEEKILTLPLLQQLLQSSLDVPHENPDTCTLSDLSQIDIHLTNLDQYEDIDRINKDI